MQNNKRTHLPIAVRAYPLSKKKEKTPFNKRKRRKCPEAMFVFDTETRTDATQRLLFGSYRFLQNKKCLEEGIFYADDICKSERSLLTKYVSEHSANVYGDENSKLLLLTREEFLEKLYRAAYKGRCLVVGFNLPFDLSRIAHDFGKAKGRFAGGFSLGIWSYIDESGNQRRHQNRPRIALKHIDSKRALKGFTSCKDPDAVDLISDDSEHEGPEWFRGHFLDLRTTAFVLTDRGYSLESACEAFGVVNGKTKPRVHGVLTKDYIDYNRQDVAASCELAFKLIEEYEKHPVDLQITKAYSPASLGKAYLRAMGIIPVMQRQPDFPLRYLGYAQSSFFGGRTSAHIRKFAVSVVYIDFLSMYPTVNGLMNLWRYVIAEKINVIEHCKEEIETFLRRINADELFKPDMWKKLCAFVKIIPDGDILPNRTKYNKASNDWQVALNYLHADQNPATSAGLWFSLPDVVASVILTGRVPKIIDAFRLEPEGILPGLKPVRLRSEIEIDPREQDFFRVVIEKRKALKSRTDLATEEKERLDKALKVLANATSYGIYAEMNVPESDEPVNVTCYGVDEDLFECKVAHPDVPGEYCFPPLAALITGAARLMLALLEHSVTSLGGTYAMEDTDSMAIVSTRDGGRVRCPGGTLRTDDGHPAVLALSWEQVSSIVKRFEALNPYNRESIPGSVLKVEDINFDPKTGDQRQIYCYAISAKRYALFVVDEHGSPSLLTKDVNSSDDGWKEHGLGHLLNPTDPNSDDRKWIAEVWLHIIRRLLNLPTLDLGFGKRPAVGRVSVSSPAVMNAFTDFNAGKSYADQIKPFNFLLACQVDAFGYPTGADPKRFHLIAPYNPDSGTWLKQHWIDQYSGKRYRVTTNGQTGNRNTARVRTCAEVLEEYEYHPESKCADAEGNACGKRTSGLLQRRHISIDGLTYIGKESNRLEDVESGTVHDEGEVYTEYLDPRRDEWTTKILPALKKMTLVELVRRVPEISRRALIDLRAGRSRPHRRNEKLLKNVLGHEKRRRDKKLISAADRNRLTSGDTITRVGIRRTKPPLW